MYSPTEFARVRRYWKFDSVLQLPIDASSPMEGLQTVSADFAAVAGRQFGWGKPTLLETTTDSISYAIGSNQAIVFRAVWFEEWGFGYFTAMTLDRFFALGIERIIQQHLPRITPEEMLFHQSAASLSDHQILMLCHMIEWGDAYSPMLSSILVEAWKSRPDQLRYELAFCFHRIVPYWRDFYPLLKDSLETSLSPLMEDYVQSAIDMMEFDMRLEGQTPD
jgi:hypothetical protein